MDHSINQPWNLSLEIFFYIKQIREAFTLNPESVRVFAGVPGAEKLKSFSAGLASEPGISIPCLNRIVNKQSLQKRNLPAR